MPARESVTITDFPGMSTRPDNLDIPPGAAVIQENMQSSYEGILRSRQGLTKITFEED